MKSIKVGIVGCGKQAAKHLAALQKIPGTGLVLADARPEAARGLADKSGCAWVADVDTLLDGEGCHAVVLCTPTPFHAPLIEKSVAAGCHVFCEKPLAGSSEEIATLRDRVAGAGVMVVVGYIYRYVPAFAEGFRLLRGNGDAGSAPVLGRPLTGFFRIGGRGSHQAWKHRRETDGGAINEMLVHMLDLANWYFGPLTRVRVLAEALRLPERRINGVSVEADAEDFILVRCTGHEGVDLFFQADLLTPAFSQYVEIQGTNGSFRGAITADVPSFVFLNEARGGYDAGRNELAVRQRNFIDAQMQSFVDAVVGKTPPSGNTIDDSLQVMRVVEQIREQI